MSQSRTLTKGITRSDLKAYVHLYNNENPTLTLYAPSFIIKLTALSCPTAETLSLRELFNLAKILVTPVENKTSTIQKIRKDLIKKIGLEAFYLMKELYQLELFTLQNFETIHKKFLSHDEGEKYLGYMNNALISWWKNHARTLKEEDIIILINSYDYINSIEHAYLLNCVITKLNTKCIKLSLDYLNALTQFEGLTEELWQSLQKPTFGNKDINIFVSEVVIKVNTLRKTFNLSRAILQNIHQFPSHYNTMLSIGGIANTHTITVTNTNYLDILPIANEFFSAIIYLVAIRKRRTLLFAFENPQYAKLASELERLSLFDQQEELLFSLPYLADTLLLLSELNALNRDSIRVLDECSDLLPLIYDFLVHVLIADKNLQENLSIPILTDVNFLACVAQLTKHFNTEDLEFAWNYFNSYAIQKSDNEDKIVESSTNFSKSPINRYSIPFWATTDAKTQEPSTQNLISETATEIRFVKKPNHLQ